MKKTIVREGLIFLGVLAVFFLSKWLVHNYSARIKFKVVIFLAYLHGWVLVGYVIYLLNRFALWAIRALRQRD